MDSLTEDPAGEVSKEMWDAFFGGVRDKEFDSPAEFKHFVVEMLSEAGIKADDIVATMAQQQQPQRPRAMTGGGMPPNHPALSGGPPR